MNKRRKGAIVTIASLVAGPLHAETTVEAYYRADLLSNSQGGLETGSGYLDDAGIVINSTFSAPMGDGDAITHAYILWNNGSRFSNRYTGDLQSISNIDAGEAIRIYELWYQQSISNAVDLRVGLYDLNTEFDSIDTAGLFLNGSHGIGAEYGLSGRAGPSVFPLTSLAARFNWQINSRRNLRYALLDGVPGDPDDPSKTTIELGDGDGVLHALEFNQTLPSETRIGIGAWLYSEEFDSLEDTDALGNPLRDDGNRGFYAFLDTPVLTGNDRGIDATAFLRYGVAEDEFNVVDGYFGAGVVATGLIRTRPDDQLGIAVARAQTGRPHRRSAGSETKSHETSVELGYSSQINDWLRLQPMLQYVMNPGALAEFDNALVFGLRFELKTSSR
ncbi:MAG: carbohydrate porin [Gammaproteobacteria bacterium]|nr:carbohydrate porin [Gammaproteobacteria bacterium]